MDKQQKILTNRLKELANLAFNKDVPMFTDFLNLDEQQTLNQLTKEFPPIKIVKFGGYAYAERVIVGFIPDYLKTSDHLFPLACIKVTNKSKKYSEQLTHRDYLGSIMGLGIDRSKLGDIIVDDQKAYVFCSQSVCDYMRNHLYQVKKNTIDTEVIFDLDDVEFKKNYKVIEGTVASIRLDAIVALGFSKSRNQIIPYIKGGKVYVNGKQILASDYKLKEGDFVSLRTVGKIIYDSTKQVTKKGRYYVRLHKLA